MLFDTSINDKETKRKINQLVGKPFNLIDMFRMGTIGSSRMEIVEHSRLFVNVMSWKKQRVFANIGMRPQGIVVIINVRLSNYTWVIPYHYLSLFKTDLLVIHGQGEYLKLKIHSDQNKKLIAKILHEKNQLETSQNYFGGI